MFRKQISPKIAGIAFVLILASVQFAYWRLLVYEPPAPPSAAPAGGGAPAGSAVSVGRADVVVQTLTGETAGYRDGALWEARFCGPNALALSDAGVLYVADSRNHRIRAISPEGQVTTVAGGGEPDGGGGRADGAALEARFSYPSGVAIGPDGTLFISDTGNHRICRLRQGQVTTLAGGTDPGEGNQDGLGAAARFHSPAALALDEAGVLWVADAGNHRIRKVEASGQVTTPAAVPEAIRTQLGEVAPAPERTLVLASAEGQPLPGETSFSLGRQSPSSARWAQLRLFADTEHRTLMLGRTGEPALLLAGRREEGKGRGETTDGDGRRASFVLPCAVVPAPDGNAYVADYGGNVIRKVLLPEWVRQGGEAPASRRNRQWRMRSGS